ncbi:hypothetical protein INT47_013275 [Mucor saturninus]|uniref:Retrotransposon gag domain-containing protein n=1 Tax=Mucor saturninus TaxID=64648 RepID=A0A8H7QF15_9FUNG|nr:hypothetical protein INT47_013275 [Mucor saturninus]
MNNNTEPSTSNMDSHPDLLSHGQNTVSRDELANILNFIYNNNNNKPANNIRIPTPPTYDGTRSVSVIDNWYVSVERYLQFNNFDESRWTEYGVTLLTGRAQLWYARATQRINHNLHNWTVFKSAIDAEFKPQFAARSARDRLFDLKQTHHIQDYIHNFQDILLEVSITDDEAIDKFIRGLKDRARAHVLMQDPVDFEAAYQCATAFESATMYGQTTKAVSTSATYIDDPMDTSINMIQQLQRQNTELLNALHRQQPGYNNSHHQRNNSRNTPNNRPRCFVCDKTGYFARDCYQRSNTRHNNGRTSYNNNYGTTGYNNYRNNENNINNRTSYNFRNNRNNTNSNQSFNAILDQYDPLNNNKDLIDLTPSGSQDPSRYLSSLSAEYSVTEY